MASPRLVGVIHLPALPGSPRAPAEANLAMRAAVERAATDARALEAAGFDLVMIENYGDVPFFPGPVPPITIAAMTACACAARAACPSLPLGVNVLRNDAAAALSVALASGAASIRVNVHTGARVTDQGTIQGQAATTTRLRRQLGAEGIAIWADVDVKHSAPLAERPLEEEAMDLVERGLADVVLVTGTGTGAAIRGDDLGRVRRALPSTHLLVASGATIDALPSLLELANGVIVGTAIKLDGRAGAAVDPDRAMAFARAFRAV